MKKEITVIVMLLTFILLFIAGNIQNVVLSYVGIGIMLVISMGIVTKRI